MIAGNPDSSMFRYTRRSLRNGLALLFQKREAVWNRTETTKPDPARDERPGTDRFSQPLAHGGVLTVLVGLSAALYVWTLDFPMEFDDHVYLVENPIFPDPTSFGYPANLEEFATRPGKLGYDSDFAVNFILRPVAYASFYLNHLLDGFNPRFYRLANILIHGCNAALLYGLLQMLLVAKVEQARLTRGSAWFISAFASLFFAAHPLATESVTYIVQRFTSMAAMFSLLALLLHVLSLQANSRRAVAITRGGSVLAALLAMQTKECSFTVPFLAVLLDRLVIGSSWRRALVRALPLLLCAPLIPFLVVLSVAALNDGWVNWESCFNIVNRKDVPFEHSHYLLTQLTVLVHYLRLLFWPSGLNLDPDWPTYRSVWQGPVLASSAMLSGSLLLAGWLFWRYRQQVRPALVFPGLLWFFLTVSISSGLVPLPDLAAEHRSYFPSIGVFVLAACVLDWMRTGQRWSRWTRGAVPAGAIAAVVALSWATCLRNEVWRDSVTLWEDTAAKSPGKSRPWGNLGTAYARAGNQVKAIECYRRSLLIDPRNQVDLLNLANSYLASNQPEKTLELTARLAEMNSGVEHVSVLVAKAGALSQLARYSEAALLYRKVLVVNPEHPAANLGLGFIFHQAGHPNRALRHYYRVREYFPEHEGVLMAIQDAQRLAGLPTR